MFWFKNFLISFYFYIHTWIVRISSALYKTEEEILKAKHEDLDEKNKHNIRQQHRNPIIERMVQGQRDEQYVNDYYEILKKADSFLKNASAEKIEMAADKHGMNLGKKDRWGRRYDHYGFYDPKHKNYGKTIGEVIESEIDERSSNDDDYSIEFMFNNKPITEGFSKNNEIVKNEKFDSGYEALNEYEKTKNKKFPMIVIRDDHNILNKIEQLTEFLHVKKIGDDYRLLEFFIDKKYNLKDNLSDKKIFNELTNIKQVWISDEYNGKYGFTINEYSKYLDNDNYDILKFKANKILKI